MLVPTPSLVRRIRDTARLVGASLVVLDPVFPLGWSVPGWAFPMPSCCTGPRWPSLVECPLPVSWWHGSSDTARWPSRPGATRPPRRLAPSADRDMPR